MCAQELTLPQCRLSVRGGHLRPLPVFSLITLRVLNFCPKPQVAEHGVQSLHSDTRQSSAENINSKLINLTVNCINKGVKRKRVQRREERKRKKARGSIYHSLLNIFISHKCIKLSLSHQRS